MFSGLHFNKNLRPVKNESEQMLESQQESKTKIMFLDSYVYSSLLKGKMH